jgi:Protein of unknown function (DUF3775)
VSKNPPSLSIATEKVCFISIKARQFDVKDVVTDPDDASNATDDSMLSVLEDHRADPVADEIRGFIGTLNVDEQIDLVALAWLGRGDGTIDDWDELRAEAARAHNKRTAAYLPSTRDSDAASPRGLSGPRRHCGHFAWSRHFDRAKVGWSRNFQIFHVLRIVEQIMNYARTLMNAIAGLDQGQLVFIHEAGPTLEHDHDVEIGDMPVPAGAFLRWLVGPDQRRNDFAARGFGDAEIPIEEEIAKAVGFKHGIAFLDMRECRFSWLSRFCSFHCHPPSEYG